jgi:hypothetical protein
MQGENEKYKQNCGWEISRKKGQMVSLDVDG